VRRNAAGVHIIPDFDPNWPTHRLCDDTGFVQHTGRWEFCLCSFGRAEKAKNPRAAEEMNHALDRLNAKVAK
jgi:hypothetical protein